jgi:hypothetical protein
MEDFNSMGAWAALKARAAVHNAAHVVAIELACACQGIEFHRPLRSTEPLERALAKVRERVPRLEQDRSLAGELADLARQLRIEVDDAVRVDDHDVTAGADRVERDCRRVGAALAAHEPRARPLRPDLELLLRGRAERVGGAERHLAPVLA